MGAGALESCLISTSKTSAMIPCAEPNDPITTVAWTGFGDRRNWTGISFCVCTHMAC